MTGDGLVERIERHSVTLVGLSFLLVAGSYAALRSGTASTIVVEILLAVFVGVALVWIGIRSSDPSVTRERRSQIANGALACSFLGIALGAWIFVLAELRVEAPADPIQLGMLGYSMGGVIGAIFGQTYAILSAKHRETVRLSRAIDSSMDGVAIVEDGQHVYVNDAYADLYGFPGPSALEGEPMEQLYTTEALRTIERETVPALDRHRYWRGQLTGKRADGSTFPMEVTSSAVEDGHVVIVRDISLQRGREQRIQVLNRILRHNLRNTFTVIQGHVNMIAEQVPTLEDAHVEPIRREIRDLLATADKARGVAKTLEDRTEGRPIEASMAVRETVDRAKVTYPDALIRSTVEETGLPLVDARITDALDELVDNAVEHADSDRPTVEVGVRSIARDDGHCVEFSVVDDGPGIPETDRRAIIEGEETPLEHGSGLGLWLVNWLVTNTGGELSFSNSPAGGTMVTITYTEEAQRPYEAVTESAKV